MSASPWFIHNSGRFDGTKPLWAKAFKTLSQSGVLITGTEAAGRGPEEFKAALHGIGWKHVHLPGGGPGDTYAAWDKAVLELVSADKHQLTDRTWRRDPAHGGGLAPFVHALVVKLAEIANGRSYWVVVVHMPLSNTELRRDIWKDCARSLVQLQKRLRDEDPEAVPVLVGDWNRNLRVKAPSTLVDEHLARPMRLHRSWDERPLPAQGTHGTKLIDFALAGDFDRCELLEDLDDSDHRAFRYKAAA